MIRWKSPYPNPSMIPIIIIFFLSILSLNHSQPIQNPNLQQAYVALLAWKSLIFSDPKNLTSNWNGPNVCSYTGVFCAPSIHNPFITVVAGIDLNHADIAGSLPEELGLLTDLALLHLNSNRFCGTIPESFSHLLLLFEIDLSNNHFAGPFPHVLLSLPSLKYLDIRYNEFGGEIPSQLFDLDLDAIFINNNKFQSALPANIGNSPVSVLVAANNYLNGCLPSSLGKMAGTLNEIILLNDGLTSCLPPEIGALGGVTVFDVGFNKLVGPLPETVGNMISLEQLNVAHNQLSGSIPASVCSLPRLENFTFSYNYFNVEPSVCFGIPNKDDQKNCIAGRPMQRAKAECDSFLSIPISCNAFGCATPQSPTPTGCGDVFGCLGQPPPPPSPVYCIGLECLEMPPHPFPPFLMPPHPFPPLPMPPPPSIDCDDAYGCWPTSPPPPIDCDDAYGCWPTSPPLPPLPEMLPPPMFPDHP